MGSFSQISTLNKPHGYSPKGEGTLKPKRSSFFSKKASSARKKKSGKAMGCTC